MRQKNIDLLVALCFGVLGMGWALLPHRPLFVGVVLAIPLVLMLPGYTLTQALLRKRAADQRSGSSESSDGLLLQPRLKIGRLFGAVDSVAFSLGLSLVIDVVVGFLLNLTPLGLRWQSWSFTLGLLTALFAALAALLRQKQPVRILAHTSGRDNTRRHNKSRPYKEGALLGAALVVAALAICLSMMRPPQPQPSFTQFWMLPSTSANSGCAVHIGVQSFEAGTVTYRIQVTSDGAQVASWSSIRLATQQEWDQLVPLLPAGGGSVFVDARLYRLDAPGRIYREVHVSLHGCGS